MFTHLGLDVASKLRASLLLLCRRYLTSQCLGRLAKGDLLRAAHGVPTGQHRLPVSLFLLRSLKKLELLKFLLVLT